MRIILISVALCLSCSFALSQTKELSFNLTFNHEALLVRDLGSSAAFYSTILGLPEIENKTKNPLRRWFSLGNGKALHLVAGDTKGIVLNRGIHLALSVTDFERFVKYLGEMKIRFTNFKGEKGVPSIRTDGVRQVYFQDPDGYWIEVNDVKQ
jgi:lactoylglutathione lyase